MAVLTTGLNILANGLGNLGSTSNGGSQQGGSSWNNGTAYSSTGGSSAAMMADAMRYNAEEAEKNRQWQERMANTAYQRAMADMKKAGLNPILAYGQGGAAVPAGSAATVTGGTDSESYSSQAGGGSNWGSSWNKTTSNGFNLLGNTATALGEFVGENAGNWTSTAKKVYEDTGNYLRYMYNNLFNS